MAPEEYKVEEEPAPPQDAKFSASEAAHDSSIIMYTPEEQATGLWDDAYDRLKKDEPTMLREYESSVCRYLTQKDIFDFSLSPQISHSPRNDITVDDRSTRRALMDHFIDIWLNEFDKEDGNTYEMSLNIGINGECSLEEILRTTVRAYPHTSLIWATLCLAIESLANTNFRNESVLSQITLVISKMEWYIALPKLIFWEDRISEPPSNSPREALINLYKAILSYGIQVVCSVQEAAQSTDEIQIREKALEDSFDRQGLKYRLMMLFSRQVYSAGEEDDRPLSDSDLSMFDETSDPASSDSASSKETPELDELLVKLLYTPTSDVTDKRERMKSWLADEQLDLYLQSDRGQSLNLIYEWAQNTTEYRKFVDWGDESNFRVLWARGDLGTGKTILMHAAVLKLSGSNKSSSRKVAYHFIDTTKFEQEDALSVVKTLISHILNFDNAGDFYAMSTVFYSLIQDPNFSQTYFVVDAVEQLAVDKEDSAGPSVFTDQGSPQDFLDEKGLSDLLNLISTSVKLSDKVKWLLSLDPNRCDARLTSLGKGMELDLNVEPDTIREIAQQYAASKVAEVANKANYSAVLHQALADKLEEIAPGNFMWLDMALDFVVLTASATPWNAPAILDELKGTMTRILSVAAVAYRPLLVSELVAIVDLPIERDPVIMVNKMLFPFLTISNGRVYFRHQSARDFIRQRMTKQELLTEHSAVTKRCLDILLQSTHDAIRPSGKVAEAPVAYATIFWIKHLSELDDHDREAFASANRLLADYLIQWINILDQQGLIQEALEMMDVLDVVLTAKTSQPINKDAVIVLQNMRSIKRFMRVHQNRRSAGKRTVTPENTLLFSHAKNPLRNRLLSQYLPWLATPPLIDPSCAPDSCVHVMSHPDWARGCCFSPDGQLVASSSDDRRVPLWSVKTEFGIFQLKTIIGVTGTRRAARVEDSVSSEDDGTADVRDIDITTTGHKLAIAVGSDVTIWEVPGFKKVSVWSEESLTPVRCVRFSPNGELVAASVGRDITIWETKSGQPFRRLLGSESQPYSSPRAEASSGGTPQVKTLGHADNINGLAFSPDSKLLASGSDDRTARIWEVDTGKMLTVLAYHDRHVNTVCFSPDGNRLATGSVDYSIGIWKQLPSGQWGGGGEERKRPDQILRGHKSSIYSVSFNPHGGSLLASVANGHDLRVWDTNMAEETTQMSSKTEPDQIEGTNTALAVNCGSGHRRLITCLALSLDGSMIASASSDGVICLWDGRTGARSYTGSSAHTHPITSLVFSREDTHLVSGSIDHIAFIWDVTPMRSPKYRLKGHTNWLRDAAFSPNGRLVATASDDCTGRVWDIHAAGQKVQNGSPSDVPVRVFNGHTDYVYSVAFSPDSRRLASGSNDRHVKIWDLVSGDATQKDKDASDVDMSHDRIEEYIRGVVFSADGEKVVSVSTDGAVAVWSPDLPQEMQCRLIVNNDLHPGPFMFMRIDREFPDVLLTEFGAWKFDISESALRKAAVDRRASRSLQLQHRPEHAPFGIGKAGRWITWKNQNLIFIPGQYQPGTRRSHACLVQGHSVVIGSDLGQVLLFRFSEDANKRLERELVKPH
ncbi:hypothetical protein F4779DRAFT_616195 [Xylariaceae sp. FL0662B]|nr:hypothetical protein F4779DRAFT_616195 [Xylariaceae sp. FL0662B]